MQIPTKSCFFVKIPAFVYNVCVLSMKSHVTWKGPPLTLEFYVNYCTYLRHISYKFFKLFKYLDHISYNIYSDVFCQ